MSHSSIQRESAEFGLRLTGLCVTLVIAWAGFGSELKAQTFSSGSTGADGALTYTTPGIYVFDPTKFTPPLNPAGDNIFNFTTITIPFGVTVKLTSKVFTGPVYWLATGDVNINGTIDLSGEDGQPQLAAGASSSRVPAAAGAGGYAGGLGGMTGGSPAQSGNGPGGGAGATTTTARGGDGTFTGNQFLAPLFGGSGGGGGLNTAGSFGAGGGGGGGAFLIASSTKIAFNAGSFGGTINADGGNCGGGCNAGTYGGAGAGGAVRLAAPSFTGLPIISSRGARGAISLPASNGTIRLEGPTSFSNTTQLYGNLTTGVLGPLLLPTTPPPSVKVTSINGTPINANPFSFPDTSINSTSPVVVTVEAHYVPIGTIPKVIIFSESGNDQTVNATALSGTLALSTATATITFPTGGSRGFVKATW